MTMATILYIKMMPIELNRFILFSRSRALTREFTRGMPGVFENNKREATSRESPACFGGLRIDKGSRHMLSACSDF